MPSASGSILQRIWKLSILLLAAYGLFLVGEGLAYKSGLVTKAGSGKQWWSKDLLDGGVGIPSSATSIDGKVLVAFLDDGLNLNNPAFNGHLWRNPADPVDGRDNDQNGFIDDSSGLNLLASNGKVTTSDRHHGDVVTSLAAAQNAGKGNIVGVSNDITVLPITTIGKGATRDAVPAAINYAVAHGARIINCSFVAPQFYKPEYDAIKKAGKAGVIVVTSAGNEGKDIGTHPVYPASYDLDNIITVGASSSGWGIPSFSNWSSEHVDLAAPGVRIGYNEASFGKQPSATYYETSGTSFSAPLVTGAIASYLKLHPDVSISEIRAALRDSVIKMPAFASKTVWGGVIDIARFTAQ